MIEEADFQKIGNAAIDLCELCRDQNLKDGYPQNFLHRD